MIFIGIDCGIKGGIAFFDEANGRYAAIPMPTTRSSVALYLKELQVSGNCTAIVERAASRPRQGVASMFKFGKGCGEILGICTALGFVIIEPTPQAWKKVVLSGTDKSKEAAIQVAENLYPEVRLVLKGCRKPHDGMADAICLMHYGRGK